MANYSVKAPDGQERGMTEDEARDFVRDYRTQHGEDELARDVIVHLLEDPPPGETTGTGKPIDPRALLL